LISARSTPGSSARGNGYDGTATLLDSATKILEIYVHLFNREQTEDEFRQAMAR
jgi:hypothetical protein